MKLRTLVVMWVSCFGLWACEETTEATGEMPAVDAATPDEGGEAAADEGAGQEAAAAEANSSPAQVCAKIVEAAKAKDDNGIVALCTEGAAGAMAGEGVKDAMYNALSATECGEAAIAEDGTQAMVKAKAGEQERDIPFVKIEDAWKLDVAAYLEKYPVEKKNVATKGKKGKKKKGKRKRRKKAK